MDEWVDVLDQDGRQTGKSILKSEAHLKGIFHPTVHIWFFTSQNEVLLQQRAQTKKTFPGLWDVSVAGHTVAGEKAKQAALREVREEIGLKIKAGDLIPVGIFKSVQHHENGILDCEFHHTFLCELRQPLSSLGIQEEEVADIKLLALDQWEMDLFSNGNNKVYVPHEGSYYRDVIRAIRRNL
ncbi:Isopentenyldiphosphate isomerase [Muriicola jejuensis]|uniref:NUDIX domain-containing protein n=1 Tax=Muriicola jejuensis TaxID=504488 RepID=A0A6P0UIT9_9FLAO|nr:NUDIX domain-containing protein [Muriicola jejuensis]NER11013.1 NUDIX domain-containing protein [Muriicola jejuensis]SMP14702.1 Isopentenyldiphosphate isomerase [Muriicola jejuensis]